MTIGIKRIAASGLIAAFTTGLMLGQPAIFAQTAKPAGDAAALYLQAAQLVVDNNAKNIMSPASSDLSYSGPPFPQEWWKLEKESFPANAPAFELTHQARSVKHADWPHTSPEHPNLNLSYLNSCRALTNELSDAALYQHLTGHDAAAIETLRDELQLADSLAADQRYMITLLVSIGIRASAMDRLNVTMSDIKLTTDAQDQEHLQRSTAALLMKQLLEGPASDDLVQPAIKTEQNDGVANKKMDVDRFHSTARRVDADCGMAAIGIACHLYKLDTGHWPASLDELHPLLPKVPIDPFGDGKQALGYVLIKGGLPNGEDRPLAYTRATSKDGLFFNRDRPFYSYYARQHGKEGGQFRDVTFWKPSGIGPATQALSP